MQRNKKKETEERFGMKSKQFSQQIKVESMNTANMEKPINQSFKKKNKSK